MRPRLLLPWSMPLLLVLIACASQPSPVVAANNPPGAAATASGIAAPPVTPKKNASVCSAQPPMKVDMFLGGACASDAECKTGKRPRCVHTPTLVGPGKPRPGPWVRACVADACEMDADCAPNELCFCELGIVGTNICAESGCHDDADCGGEPGSCATDTGPPPWPSSLPPPRHVPHYCRSAADECKAAADCKSNGCMFDKRAARFTCVQIDHP